MKQLGSQVTGGLQIPEPCVILRFANLRCLEKVPNIFSQSMIFMVMHPYVECNKKITKKKNKDVKPNPGCYHFPTERLVHPPPLDLCATKFSKGKIPPPWRFSPEPQQQASHTMNENLLSLLGPHLDVRASAEEAARWTIGTYIAFTFRG